MSASLTQSQFNVIYSALGHTGYLNEFDDRRTIKALDNAGYIAITRRGAENHGFCYSLTQSGIRACMAYIVKQEYGMDFLMMSFCDKLKNFSIYAERYYS